MNWYFWQVWSLFHIPSNLWFTPCLDCLFWYWEERLQCWGFVTWDGSHSQAKWFHNHSGQTTSGRFHKEVFVSFTLGSSSNSWFQFRFRSWRGWHCVYHPKEVVVDEWKPQEFWIEYFSLIISTLSLYLLQLQVIKKLSQLLMQ